MPSKYQRQHGYVRSDVFTLAGSQEHLLAIVKRRKLSPGLDVTRHNSLSKRFSRHHWRHTPNSDYRSAVPHLSVIVGCVIASPSSLCFSEPTEDGLSVVFFSPSGYGVASYDKRREKSNRLLFEAWSVPGRQQVQTSAGLTTSESEPDWVPPLLPKYDDRPELKLSTKTVQSLPV